MANIDSMNVGGQLSMIEDTAAREMEANAYDTTQTYAKEDICIYNDKLYEANTAIATPEAFNIAHWTETTLGKIAQKHRDSISQLTEKTTITPTPITGLEFTPATSFVKGGVAYLNCQISNRTTAAIDMTNGKVIATGLPIPYKKQQVYTEAIPWNNEYLGSDAKTTPLRLCINANGQLCSFYPSTKEKITVGMPICINMSYPVED